MCSDSQRAPYLNYISHSLFANPDMSTLVEILEGNGFSNVHPCKCLTNQHVCNDEVMVRNELDGSLVASVLIYCSVDALTTRASTKVELACLKDLE